MYKVEWMLREHMVRMMNLLIYNCSNSKNASTHTPNNGPIRPQPEKYLFWQDCVNSLQSGLNSIDAVANFLDGDLTKRKNYGNPKRKREPESLPC
jgi:hypothetical protein